MGVDRWIGGSVDRGTVLRSGRPREGAPGRVRPNQVGGQVAWKALVLVAFTAVPEVVIVF